MRLSDTYAILDVKPGATLDEIKASYRKLAFKYHPDLHPGDERAARRFTHLNEAYVLLKKHLEAGTDTTGRRQYSAETIREEEEARIRRGGRPSGGFSARQEEVLRDILNDPFAKQVFEDIFSKLKRGMDPDLSAPKTDAPVTRTSKTLNLKWGDKGMSLDMGRGVIGAVKDWAAKQLDDHQTVRVPARNLIPGTTLRVQIRHRFQGEPRTIEVRLPGDFVVGRPIRLKGLGRHLGPWKGDLYLRLLVGPDA